MKRVPSIINKASKRLIVVLGMHRSGTSATTRALQVLGVDLGDNLMPGIVGNNEKGFWEDLDINKLNIELLQFISHDWHTLTPIPCEELKNENLADLRQKAIDLLRKKTKSVSIFGIKDPRMTRLLPFWQDIFNKCKFDVSYVIAIRNPLSVAESLYARDSFLKEKSCYMWLVNVLPSIIETEGKPRVIVDYDGIMDNPSFEIMRIAKTLGLEGRMNPDELNKFENEFIEERLRHSRYQPEDLNLDPFAPSIVIEMYGTLLQVAHDKLHFDSAEVQRCVARSTAHLKDIYPALRYMTCQNEQIASLGQAVSERDGQIASLNQAVAERDGQIVGLNQSVSERDGQIASFSQAMAERDSQIASLTQDIEGRDEQLVSLRNTIAERDVQIDGLNQIITDRENRIVTVNQSVAERDAQIASLNQAVVARDEQIASLSQSVSEHDKQIASLSQSVAARDEQIASLNQAVVARDGQIASLSQAMAERDGQIASLNQAMAKRDNQINNLEQMITTGNTQISHLHQVLSERENAIQQILLSKSWRVTRPLRALGALFLKKNTKQ